MLTCEGAYLFALARDHFSSIRSNVCRSSIRFVAVDVVFTEAPDPVANPSPAFTTAWSSERIVDAEQLLSGSGPISAVTMDSCYSTLESPDIRKIAHSNFGLK
jgi:hypothetical protein